MSDSEYYNVQAGQKEKRNFWTSSWAKNGNWYISVCK